MDNSLTFFQALILAFVQGATEFIPVSSSGHLVLLRRIFGWTDDGGLVFDTVLHAGSLAAIAIYFWRDWQKVLLGLIRPSRVESFYRRLPWLLVAATLPVVAVAPFLKPMLDDEAGVRNAGIVGLSMLATALWFRLCDRRTASDAQPLERYGWRTAFWTGCAQIVALLPGASRSGWTAGAGIFSGYQRSAAVKFAFFMAAPAILGAVILQAREIFITPPQGISAGIMLAGFLMSLAVSLAAIRFCLWFFRAHSFRFFSYYLLVAGILIIILN